MIKRLLDLPITNVTMLSIFWSLEIIFIKLAFEDGAHIVTLIIQYFILSFIIFVLIVFLFKRQQFKDTSMKILLISCSIYIIHAGFGTFFVNIGITTTEAINAGFLVKSTLVFTTLFAWIFLKEKINLIKIVSIFILSFGLFLLVTKGQFIVPHFGDLLILLACISWSIAGVMMRAFLKNNPQVSITVISMFKYLSGVVTILFFVSLSDYYPDAIKGVFAIDILNFKYIDYVIILAIANVLLTLSMNKTLHIASASYMTMMTMMVPVIVTVLAFFIFDERMVSIQVIGAVLIIVSAIITHKVKIQNH